MSTFWTAARNRITRTGNAHRRQSALLLSLIIAPPFCCSSKWLQTQTSMRSNLPINLKNCFQKISSVFHSFTFGLHGQNHASRCPRLSQSSQKSIRNCSLSRSKQKHRKISLNLSTLRAFRPLLSFGCAAHSYFCAGTGPLRSIFYHQYRATLYSTASLAQTPAASPRPL